MYVTKHVYLYPNMTLNIGVWGYTVLVIFRVNQQLPTFLSFLESVLNLSNRISLYNPFLPGKAQCQSSIASCHSTDFDRGTAITGAVVEQNTLKS